MSFSAHTKYVRYSPYKLRPIADVIRGKDVLFALNWLRVHRVERAVPIRKTLESAVANAKDLKGIEAGNLVVREIRVDQGPAIRYFKPSAQGRSAVQRKRLSHVSITLDEK